MRSAIVTTLLVLASACFFERGTQPSAVPQKNALSRCYDDRCPKPMFIVDGKQLADDSVDLNPSDIESVEVFKGELAIKQYGDAARNGVVVITTKRTLKSNGATRE